MPTSVFGRMCAAVGYDMDSRKPGQLTSRDATHPDGWGGGDPRLTQVSISASCDLVCVGQV